MHRGWMCGLFILSGWVRAATAAPPALSPEIERSLGLLQYVASDYAVAVSEAGTLISRGEFDEQLELLEFVRVTLASHRDARVTPLAKAAQALHEAALRRSPPSELGPRTRRLHAEIIRIFEISLAPRIVPTLAAGRILYGQACAACHGEDGRAETPQARTLEPRPADFLSAAVAERLSPYQVFNILTFGIAGTSMASFETLDTTERWDLAFYVLSLRHSGVAPAAVAASITVPTLAELARATDPDLERLLADHPAAERAAIIAQWRHVLPIDLGR